MNCPGCREALPDHAKFCPTCGAARPGPSYCTQCGSELAGGQFCGDCGAPVSGPPPGRPTASTGPAPGPRTTPPRRRPVRPGRWWPHTFAGNALYLLVIGASTVGGFMTATQDPGAAERAPLVAVLMGFSGWVTLTLWRNLLIANDALTPLIDDEADDGTGSSGSSGGIQWGSILMILAMLGVSKCARDQARQSARPRWIPTQRTQPVRTRRAVGPIRTRPQTRER